MAESAKLKSETSRRLNQFKLDNNFRSVDLVINFLFNFYIAEQKKALIIEDNRQKEAKREPETTGLNTLTYFK